MESPSPLNYTRKFFGDQAADVDDFSLIQSFVKQNNIDVKTPMSQIVAQIEEKSLGKLREQNANSNLKATRRLFGESSYGIDDNQLALSFAKSQGVSPDTPIADVFKQMEEKSRIKLAESDRSLGGDTVYGLDQLGAAVDFIRENDEDKRSGFQFGAPDLELDLEGVSQFLRPEETRPNIFKRIGQEVLSLDFFASDLGREVGRVASTFGDETGRTTRLNSIDRELNNPEAISRFVAEVERYKESPELFSDEERDKLFKAAKLFETTNAFFDVEKSGAGQFLASMDKSVVMPVAKGINQMLGTAFDAADIDQDFTDSVLRDMNFTDQALAETDPESKAAIAGNIAGSVVQTVLSIMSGAGPAAMFALYGTQGAGGNIETYRAIARDKGFDPDIAEQALVGLGGMVIAGGLGALLTGKTIGQIPLIKSFEKGGEKAIFDAASRAGMFQGVKAETLFQTGLNAVGAVFKNRAMIPQAAKSYLRFAASTGSVEALEEVSEDALNEGLMNLVVDEAREDFNWTDFGKSLALSGLGGFIGGGAIGPAVKSRARTQLKNASRNILGLSDIAPQSVDEARANLNVLNEREKALKTRFNGELPFVMQQDISETRNKLQAITEGVATPEEAFPGKKDNPFSRFVSPLGDVAGNGRLKGTGFQEAAEAALGEDEMSVAGQQVDAFREFMSRLDNSDLPQPVKDAIIGRARMTRMGTAGNKRNAVTIHDVDEQGNRSLHGIYFTNGASKKSAYDELFHVIVDSADSQTQQDIVDGFNQTYNARAVNYDTAKTRDRIASRVAAIMAGEEDLPDVDNAFTRAVRNMQDGQFLSINLNLADGSRMNTSPEGPTQLIALDEMNAGLNDGRYRMVSVPGLENNTTFQSEDGTVYEYVISEDSEGNAQGVVKALGVMDKLPTIGVPNTRAIAPFVSPTVILPGGGTSESGAERQRQEFADRNRPVAPGQELVVQRPENRFGTIVPGEGTTESFAEDDKATFPLFKQVRERLKKENLIPSQPVSESESLIRIGSPQDQADLLLAHIQRLADNGQEIPARLLERFNEMNRVAGLLPPAQNQGVRVGEGQATSASRENPTPFAPAPQNTGPVSPDQAIIRSVPSEAPALGPETFDQDRLVELASEAIRILEARGEPVPQALLNIITVDAEITDVSPPTQGLGPTPRPQLQQAVEGPTNYAEFLQATAQTPDGFAEAIRNRLFERQNRDRKAKLLPQNAGPDSKGPQRQATESAILAELDPRIVKNIPPELLPAVEALVTGNQIEGVTSVGENDAVTGFPLMEVSEQAADALASIGVAVTGKIQIEEDLTETLPTIVSFNPDALAEVATATETPQTDVEVQGAQEAFNEALVDSENVTYHALEDEVGGVVRYPTKQAARNALENQFAGETESIPGRGGQDIITIGSREYILTEETQPTAEVLQEGFGDRASKVGAILATLNDSPDKTKLIKAAKKVARQLKYQAQGNFKFNEKTLNDALANLDEVIDEVNPGIDLQGLTNAAEADQNVPDRTELDRVLNYAEESEVPINEEIDLRNDVVHYILDGQILASEYGDGRVEVSDKALDVVDQRFINDTVFNSEESVTEDGDQVSDNQLAKLEKKAEKEVQNRRKKFEVEGITEATTETEQEVPVDLNDSTVKTQVRRMRQRIKRSRFNRLDSSGMAEFRSNKTSAIDSFVEKAKELGATQVDRRKVDGENGTEHIVEVQFHPEIANQIFQDQIQEATTGNPVQQFANYRPIDPEQQTITSSTVLQPTFSAKTPGRLRGAVTDAVKGLKLRANIHVTTFGEAMGGFYRSGNSIEEDMFNELQHFAVAVDVNEGETRGVAVHRIDDQGRLHVLIGINQSKFDLESDEALEILSHEMGHVISKDILNREEHDAAYQQLTTEHQKFVEENQNITVDEFIRKQRLPSLFTKMIEGKDARQITMRQLRNDPQLRQSYEYLTSFEEWFADQVARWMTTGVTHTVTQEQTGLFKSIAKRMRSLFDRFKNRGAYPPNKTFEQWINDYVESLQEGNVNFLNPASGTRMSAHSIAQEDSMPLEFAAPFMPKAEVEARNMNEFEFSVNSELAIMRDEIPNWISLEQAVREGKSAAGIMPTQELVEKARHYERLYQASLAMINRPAPMDMPLDVMASYSTAAGLIPDTWSQRLDDWYQAYRDSTFNQVRRRLISTVITRGQIAADQHPELQSVQTLMDKIFASAGRAAGDTPYVDRVQQEITLRTQAISNVINPIFEAFGFTNTGIQKALVGLVRGKKMNDVVRQVYMGVRNKEWVKDHLNDQYNGVRLETIIDNMREHMDDLRNYAVSKGLLTADEFITYKDAGKEHYVPRVYDQETVRANFGHFKVHIIERNLRRVYKKDAYIDFLQETNPSRLEGLTDEQIDDIEVPDSFKIFVDKDGNPTEDDQIVTDAAEQIAANIAFGRTTTFAKQFNPDNFSGHENFVKIMDRFGTRVPDRMKRRKLFFVPDEELLGRTEVAGRKINYLETNIVDVMGRSIEQIVKRGEYKEVFEDGQVFARAYQDLKDKQRKAEGQGDAITSNKIDNDLDAINALYESVAEVVDLDGHKSIQNGPIRDLLSSFARASTISVMGLSTILAVVELGNIPLRVGVVPGIKAILQEGVKLGLKKVAAWPGAAIGKGKNYTSVLEDELTIMGYLHNVGEDFAARVKTDNPFDSDSGVANPLGTGTLDVKGSAPGETFAKVARNLASGLEFAEDVFYRVTMLEQMTRLSQVVAAHAASDLILDIMNTADAGPLNAAQNRELKRLGFVDGEGNLDMDAFNEYKQFHSGLRQARKQGKEALAEYAKANEKMFRGTHFRVTTRLVNQMIARPNVVTRPKWGNSKNPLKRMMYRLRSFTHGYRELAARFYTDEFRNIAQEEGAWGIARMLARFLPLFFMAMLSVVARAELSAYLHESVGNTTQAERIRTIQKNKTPIDFMIEGFDKSGMTLQASEVIGGVQGLQYGNSIWSVIGGVTASKLEKLADASMQTATSGDPAFLWNNITDFAPGANTGVWDGLKLDTQKTSSQNASDMDYYDMLNGSEASWW